MCISVLSGLSGFFVGVLSQGSPSMRRAQREFHVLAFGVYLFLQFPILWDFDCSKYKTLSHNADAKGLQGLHASTIGPCPTPPQYGDLKNSRSYALIMPTI